MVSSPSASLIAPKLAEFHNAFVISRQIGNNNKVVREGEAVPCLRVFFLRLFFQRT